MGKQGTGIPSLSRKMNHLRYRDIRLLAGAVLLILGLSSALACLLLDGDLRERYREELNQPVPFQSDQPAGYSYVKLQYLTDSFAEHVKKADDYYFGFDFMFRPYIISVRGELPKELMALMEYTYGDAGAKQPPAVAVYGYGEPVVPELLGYARESYSRLWSESQIPITMEDLSEIVGGYYLDTVPRTYLEQYPRAILFYVLPFLMAAAGGIYMILYFRRLGAQRRRLSGRGGELLAADRELACTEDYAKGAGIYLTEHFVITAAYAFDVIPYTRISRVENTGGLVIIVTEDDHAHIAAGGRRTGQYLEKLNQDLKIRLKEEERGDSYAAISGN